VGVGLGLGVVGSSPQPTRRAANVAARSENETIALLSAAGRRRDPNPVIAGSIFLSSFVSPQQEYVNSPEVQLIRVALDVSPAPPEVMFRPRW
jgi:hypothetical protein